MTLLCYLATPLPPSPNKISPWPVAKSLMTFIRLFILFIHSFVIYLFIYLFKFILFIHSFVIYLFIYLSVYFIHSFFRYLFVYLFVCLFNLFSDSFFVHSFILFITYINFALFSSPLLLVMHYRYLSLCPLLVRVCSAQSAGGVERQRDPVLSELLQQRCGARAGPSGCGHHASQPLPALRLSFGKGSSNLFSRVHIRVCIMQLTGITDHTS